MKKGQAAIELAIFGSIVIFILGSIVRTAVANSYQQNQSFKAMRMAMLASYIGSQSNTDQQATPMHGLARNSASILLVEDRLSPDASKYGSMDRAPQMTSGSGTFTYQLMNIITSAEIKDPKNIPVMDVYINGQHFPLSTAAWNPNFTVTPKSPLACGKEANPDNCKSPPGQNPKGVQEPYTYTNADGSPNCSSPLKPGECTVNRCLRDAREWVVPQGTCPGPPGSCSLTFDPATNVYSGVNCTTAPCMADGDCAKFNNSTCKNGFCTGLCGTPYKLFYSQAINGTSNYTVAPITCANHPNTPCPSDPSTSCQSEELSNDLQQVDSMTGNLYTNDKADMQFDLLRNADYLAVDNPNDPTKSQFPQCTVNGNPVGATNCKGVCQCWPPPPAPGCAPVCLCQTCSGKCDDDPPVCKNGSGTCNAGCDNNNPIIPNSTCPVDSGAYAVSCLRADVAWQWNAAAGRSDGGGKTYLGLDDGNGQPAACDVDGRLKEVLIYSIKGSSDHLTLGVEDLQGGDMDNSWDINSCGPKPGLQSALKLYGFVGFGPQGINGPNGPIGTYLQIKEGQLCNPQTGQCATSVNKRYNVDLIQREIQLSNNTYRFCYPPYLNAPANAGYNAPPLYPPPPALPGGEKNPVEVCVAETSAGDSCFCSMNPSPGQAVCLSGQDNIKLTCFDAAQNKIYVRSRIRDLSGRSWFTDTGGKLGIK